MHYQSRGGVRGGQDQFKWDNVKLMSYKDRECYLGSSSKLGFLDKGGKWRHRDWYAHVKDTDAVKSREDELKQIKLEEKAMMNFRLGIKDEYNQGCTELKQVLERVRKDQKQASSLTTIEIKELTRRDKDEVYEEPDRQKGIGFES